MIVFHQDEMEMKKRDTHCYEAEDFNLNSDNTPENSMCYLKNFIFKIILFSFFNFLFFQQKRHLGRKLTNLRKKQLFMVLNISLPVLIGSEGYFSFLNIKFYNLI